MTEPEAGLNLESLDVAGLLDQLAAKSPVPGGGAAASLVGSVAVSLTSMVINYTIGKKKYAAWETELTDDLAACRRTRMLLMKLADEDVAAYARLNELMRRPEGDEERAAELAPAAVAATQVPLAVLAACCDHLRLCGGLVDRTNRMLRSDLEIAVILAAASAHAAECNVRINLPLLGDLGLDGGVREEADRLVTLADSLRDDALGRTRAADG